MVDHLSNNTHPTIQRTTPASHNQNTCVLDTIKYPLETLLTLFIQKMKSSPLINAVAGLIGFAGLINAQTMDNPACEHSDTKTVVSLDTWYDTVDVPGFCSWLRGGREAKSNCAATNTPICEVTNGRFEWSFETAGPCTADDIHEIWTAAGGNELINYIYC